MKNKVKEYTKLFKKGLKKNGFKDYKEQSLKYSKRLEEMYRSEKFKEHNIYPTMDMCKIYSIVLMCLILKEEGLSKEETLRITNSMFDGLRKVLSRIEKIIDALPFAWKIVKKWNIGEYKDRLKDQIITFENFMVMDEKISYRISKCMYCEIFSYYGIREYCKIFCNTDISAYSNLTKHVGFIRHSDLSDGEACDDVLYKKRRLKK